MVGVMVHDVLNPYFAEIFRALETALNARALAMMICNHGDDLARQQTFVETLMQHRAGGLIMCPAIGTRRPRVNRIARPGCTLRLMICRAVDGAEVPIVRGDGSPARRATRHLVAEGHRRIAFVGGRRATSAGREAPRQGYVAALAESGDRGRSRRSISRR